MPRHMCETPKKRQTSKTGVLVSINLSLNRWGNIYRADTSGWKWALCAGGVKTLTRLVRLEGWVIKKKKAFPEHTEKCLHKERHIHSLCVQKEETVWWSRRQWAWFYACLWSLKWLEVEWLRSGSSRKPRAGALAWEGGASSTHPASGSRSQAWKSHHNERLRWGSHCLLARMPTVWEQAELVGLLPHFHLTFASDFCGDLYCYTYPRRPPFLILQRPAQLFLFQKTTVVRDDLCEPEWVAGGEECRREGTHKCV